MMIKLPVSVVTFQQLTYGCFEKFNCVVYDDEKFLYVENSWKFSRESLDVIAGLSMIVDKFMFFPSLAIGKEINATGNKTQLIVFFNYMNFFVKGYTVCSSGTDVEAVEIDNRFYEVIDTGLWPLNAVIRKASNSIVLYPKDRTDRMNTILSVLIGGQHDGY